MSALRYIIWATCLVTTWAEVYIQPGQVHEIKIEPKPTKADYSFRVAPNEKVRVFCDDFRLPIGAGCNYGGITLDDGVEQKKHCETVRDMRYESKRDTLKIGIDLMHGGYVECVVKTTEEPKASEIAITPYEESYLIDVRNKKHAPFADLVWKFASVPNSKISARCSKSLSDKTPCLQVAIYINDGEETKEYCGSDDLEVISKNNKMGVRVTMDKWGEANVRCVIQGITGPNADQAKNLVSEEVDSREHGVKPGQIGTSCQCGWTNKEQTHRIFHGKETKEGEYPWMVALKRKSGGFICGGSIISPHHVLTAAHCVLDSQVRKMENYEPLEVIVGGYDLEKASSHGDMQTIDVKQPFIRKEWLDFSRHYDISVLLLETKIKFSKFVGPVCLPNPNKPYKILYQRLKITGWGLTHEHIYPTKLKTTRLFVMDKNTCPSPRGIVCTYSRTSSICYGDSGSPLVYLDPETNRYTQISVNSYTNIDHCVSSSGSANVSYHFDWVKGIVDATLPQQLCMKN